MRIIISAGGTGGGVYPAFAVAEALQNPESGLPAAALIFAGGTGKQEVERLQRSGINWYAAATIQSGPVRGVNPLRMAASIVRLTVGVFQSLWLLRRYQAQRVLVTGGWASLPIGAAAWLMRIPMVAFVPDIEPGATLRLLGRLARKVAVTTPDSAAYVDTRKLVVTGYPLRGQVLRARRERAIEHFSLDPARRTLLVTGGSQGARSINRAIMPLIPALVAAGWQIIHLTGSVTWEEVQAAAQNLTSAERAHYHPFVYLHDDMGLALAAADLAVSRSGGVSVGEFPQFGIPAILVPYPHAWRYQKVNADYLVRHGAALRLDDERLADDLAPAITALVDDPAALSQMAAQARALARPDGAYNLARLLIELERS